MSESPFPGGVDRAELQRRRRRCQTLLARHAPGAGGLLAFSRLNIYYLTGSLAAGILWVPLEGEAVLLCRRGEARARLESPLEKIGSYRSFREISGLLSDGGSPLTPVVAAEMGGLSWSLSSLLQRHLPDTVFLPGDPVLAEARSVKSEWELERLRRAGGLHALCLETLLPPRIGPGMTEMQIALQTWDLLLSRGHHGLLRMGGFGEEVFLGHVAAGEDANFPSVLNGPVGLRGLHPSVPFMGSPAALWKAEELLVVDVGFSVEGYQTDKTQVYWSGDRRRIPPETLRAHELCVRIEEMLAERLRPGAIPAELAGAAFDLARREGCQEGFMALGGNKVPFVGHGIGLAIDEQPVLAAGFESPLEEGMVIALEPKIGLPGVGMVGLENTFEVTKSGGVSLTGGERDIICVAGP